MVERTVDVKVRPRLDAVTVRPGDKLVVRVEGQITREDVDDWTDRLSRLLPGIDVVFVAGQQMLVYRPNADADE